MKYENTVYNFLKKSSETYARRIQKEFCSKKPIYNDILEHSEFVCDLALKIGEKLNADLEILKVSALLHDVGITMEDSPIHAVVSAKIAEEVLENTDFPEEKRGGVLYAISVHSDLSSAPIETLEAKILWDADKIAHLGAVVFVRFLMRMPLRGGNTKKALEFFKKNLKTAEVLKENMKTELGKEIAAKRYEFAKIFVEELEEEMGG
ncbi:MAG: HD domain-containing protein [Theionarchaea archaeon]|nr:HD domain-containing protein [Theionarchaea archaeon]